MQNKVLGFQFSYPHIFFIIFVRVYFFILIFHQNFNVFSHIFLQILEDCIHFVLKFMVHFVAVFVCGSLYIYDRYVSIFSVTFSHFISAFTHIPKIISLSLSAVTLICICQISTINFDFICFIIIVYWSHITPSIYIATTAFMAFYD